MAEAQPSRWRRRLAIAGIALAALAIALRAALPYALERAIPIGAERFGLTASVENVDLALLSGHLAVEGLRVAGQAPTVVGRAAPDLLELGRVFANLEWLRLLRGELELAELALLKPVISLVRAADGTLELPSLAPSDAPEPPAAPEPPEPETAPAEPLPVALKAISIQGAEFHLVDAGGGANLLDFALAELGFTDLRLVGAKLGLGGIRISEPRLRVRREVQTTRTAARSQAESAPEAAAGEAGAPPEFRIDDLEIERAEFTVLSDGEPLEVALRLKTSGVSLAPNAPFPVDLGLEAGKGRVAVKGQLALNPVAWDGSIGWQGLEVPMFVRAALPELIPWIRSCSASGDLALKLGSDGIRASGRFGVDAFAFEDPEQELALGWESLAIELVQASVPTGDSAEPIQIALGKISLEAPQLHYVLPNTSLARLSPHADAAPPEPAAAGEAAPAGAAPAAAPASAPASAEPRITVDSFELRRGGIEFVDRSRAEIYQGRVRDLSVEVSGLTLPERNVKALRMRGIAPERAPFELKGSLTGGSGTLRFSLERLPLAQFSPYAKSAADLKIPRGDLSLETQARFERSGAAGKVESKVIVRDLAIVGGASAISVAGMPLDLALALLRDPKGAIELPLPLAYDEQGASAGIGEIVVGAMRAAIAGAVTSPIKALGMLVPEGGAAELSSAPIAYLPGDARPPADARETLAPLAALLAQRPGLGLALIGRAGPDDRLPLAERILIELVAAERDLPALEDAGFFARRRIRNALEERGRGEAGALEPEDQALFARALDAVAVPSERYAELARRRAEALRDLLASAHALAPARLAVEIAAEPASPGVLPELRVAAAGDPAPEDRAKQTPTP